jgi:hypothetical protein
MWSPLVRARTRVVLRYGKWTRTWTKGCRGTCWPLPRSELTTPWMNNDREHQRIVKRATVASTDSNSKHEQSHDPIRQWAVAAGSTC